MADQQQDLKVRLSAEGLQDVVGALKKVQQGMDDTAKHGKEAHESVSLLGESFEQIKDVLPAIGLALAIDHMKELVVQALESADAIGKLSAKTGITTETLSALAVAGELADVTQEQLTVSMAKFAKVMGEVDDGNVAAGKAVRELFGNYQALNGLSMELRFEKVATAIGKMPAGIAKASTAMQFFGKGASQLIPLFNDIAEKGMGALTEKAQALGLLLSKDMTDAAQRANDALKETQLITKGLAMEFASGFAPAVANAFESFNAAVEGKGISGMKKLGEFVGAVAQVIVGAFLVVGKTVGMVMGVIEDRIHNTSQTMVQFAKNMVLSGGNPALALGKTLGASGDKETQDRTSAIFDSYKEDLVKSLDELWHGQSEAEKGHLKDMSENAEQALREQEAALKASLEKRKALLAASLQDFLQNQAYLEQANQNTYDKGLESTQEYYNKRRQIVRDSVAAEILTLQQQKVLAAAQPVNSKAEQIKQSQELAILNEQIASKEGDRAKQLGELNQNEWAATKQLNETKLSYEQKLLEAQGKRHEAAMLGIDDEAKKYDEFLRKLGVPDGSRSQQVEQLRRTQIANEDFSNNQERSQQALNDLTQQQVDLQNQVNSGKLFQSQADESLRQSEAAALPDLQRRADLLKESAITPEQVQQARDFSNAVATIAQNVDKAGQDMKTLKGGLEDAVNSGVTTFLQDIASGTKSVGDAFRDMGLAVVQSIEQIIIKMIAMKVVESMFSSSAGYSGGGQVNASDMGGVQAATGGFISGPGTGTSDSIPARLSDGEFVMRAAVVSQPGMLDMLNSLNRKGSPAMVRHGAPRKFADGGLVSASTTAGSSSGDASMTVGLEEGLVLRHLETAEGQRTLVRVISKNRHAVRSGLGV